MADATNSRNDAALPQLVPRENNAGVRVLSNKDLEREDRKQAEARQARPELQGIVSYVHGAWEEAQSERLQVEERMMRSLRQRRGEYDAGKLMEIREQGGSEIYMMITSVKCRAAASWLRDALMGTGTDKPWTIEPTPVPELPPPVVQNIVARVQREVMKFVSAGGAQPTPDMIQTAIEIAKERLTAEQNKVAKRNSRRMETKMEDELWQGGFDKALFEFVDDLVTFPTAFIKGPVIRKKKRLQWAPDGTPIVEDKLVKEWERVSALYIYPSPQSESVHDGYLIERHIMERHELNELIGVEGYDDGAIRAVLEDYRRGGLNEWLNIDTGSDSREETRLNPGSGLETPAATIDGIQFWGDIPGQMLIDWGMSEDEITDPTKDYSAEVWVIGNWCIKATLNPDPLRRRPYYKASYEEIPGQFWGHGVTDLIRDVQNVCNAAARSLVNNMGFASGPQMWVNVDQLADGEEITQLIPWKIHQGKSDPLGGSGPPVGFFQPNSLSQELMAVYDKFSTLADEYSGVPKYMTGGSAGSGAGRTATGFNMMMQNAGKVIKQVLANVDQKIIQPLLEMQFYYNMMYSDDPDVKLVDINIVARGARGLIAREAQQIRLNEFLGLAIGNQTVAQIIGPEGIAMLLRQGAEQLDLDTDKIVPSEEILRAQQMMQEQMEMQRQAASQAALQAAQTMPVEQIQFRRGADGEVQGMDIMPGAGQQLMDGATPVNAQFQQPRRA